MLNLVPLTTPNKNNMFKFSSLNSSMVFNGKNMIEKPLGVTFANSYEAKEKSNFGAKITPSFK